MNKLKIKLPIDILPELKEITNLLKDAKDLEWSYEKNFVIEARARLIQLISFINKSGEKKDEK